VAAAAGAAPTAEPASGAKSISGPAELAFVCVT